jgi:penicillin-binding protein 1A
MPRNTANGVSRLITHKNFVMKKYIENIKRLLSKVKQILKRFGHWYVHRFKGQPWWYKAIAGIISFVVFVILYFTAVNLNFLWLFGKSPTIHSIMHPETSEASELYSEDSVLIGKYFNENRTPVEYEEINPVFFKALIDTEDERFYSHHGIDFQGLFAAFKDILKGHARGASTLTQQLVKNMFRVRTQYSTGLLGKIPGVKILIMKSKEWVLAVELEMFYEKKEILTMYANTVDFGSNAFGIKTAAKTYFNTTPKDLTAEQAAVLVGLLKATSTYNPRINPENSIMRRNVVLDNMQKHGHLTKQECDSIKKLPLGLNYKVETVYDGKALYFREAVANYLRQWCKDNGIDLYSAGLKIYSTLNYKMQKYAEEALVKQMRTVQRNFRNHWGDQDPWRDENHNVIPNFIEDLAKKTDHYKALSQKYDNEDSIFYYLNQKHKVKLFDYDGEKEEEMSTIDSIRYMVKFMHAGFVSMEPQNGHVKAWVGDIDFKSWKYDKVTAMRQPGSTFKLFVYTEAMNQGLTPCDRRLDDYISLDVMNEKGELEPWRPHNANGYFTGDSIPLLAAFAQSINSVAVRVGMEVGTSNIVKTAHNMGIKSPLHDTPSISLGSSDVNLLELVNAYSTVVDDGRVHEPVLVTKIVDRHGKVIYTAKDESHQAIPYRSAFFMQQLLQGGLREYGGTSMALWRFVRKFDKSTSFGGKTGTSNNHSDAWFVGVTPGLVSGAWVGGEYRSIHFRTGALGQGSRTALPIVGYYLESVLDDPQFSKYRRKFPNPKEDIDRSCYSCTYIPRPREEEDSTEIDLDSLSASDFLILDDPKAADEKKADEEVNFDDILNESGGTPAKP